MPDQLTIEHVLPQTPTPDWRAELGQDLDSGETFDQVHQSLVHTLANLTLTGYNPKLSNSSFTKKRELLATSGLSMNQEIAAQSCWGRPQIQARGADLAHRIAQEWPGPERRDRTAGPSVGGGGKSTGGRFQPVPGPRTAP